MRPWRNALILLVGFVCGFSCGDVGVKEMGPEKPVTPQAPAATNKAQEESFSASDQQRKAIEDSLNAVPEFNKVGFTIVELEVSGVWALATIEPKAKESAEGAAVLLKNDNGWKMLDYGTELTGIGEEFGVPVKLIERWEL